jgi:cytochrome c
MKFSMPPQLTAALILTAAFSTPAFAIESEQLAKDKMCFHCHEIKGEKHGPAFQEIARRFAGQSNARRQLVKEIQAGTYGPGVARHWGNVKMPKGSDRVEVSEAEAEQLVDYVLNTK